MSTQAKVTSTEALETFRASLIVFLTKSRRAVDDAADEVKRTRQWLQHDQKTHWEGEYRRKAKQLQQAQAELMSARMGADAHRQSALMARQMAVSKAQKDLADAEAKIRKLKAWSMNFDTATDPVVKRMDRLRQSLNDLPKAIAYLVTIQNLLAAYSESGGPAPSSSEGFGTSGDLPPDTISEVAPESAPETPGEEAKPEPEPAPEHASTPGPDGQT